MRITKRQLRKIIKEHMMSDDPEFPQKTDLSAIGPLSKLPEEQRSYEERSKRSFRMEPREWSNELDQFIEMLGSKDTTEEEFVFHIWDRPNILPRFFDISGYSVKMKPRIIEAALEGGQFTKAEMNERVETILNVIRSD